MWYLYMWIFAIMIYQRPHMHSLGVPYAQLRHLATYNPTQTRRHFFQTNWATLKYTYYNTTHNLAIFLASISQNIGQNPCYCVCVTASRTKHKCSQRSAQYMGEMKMMHMCMHTHVHCNVQSVGLWEKMKQNAASYYQLVDPCQNQFILHKQFADLCDCVQPTHVHELCTCTCHVPHMWKKLW